MIVEHAEQRTNLALAPRPLHKVMAIWVRCGYGMYRYAVRARVHKHFMDSWTLASLVNPVDQLRLSQIIILQATLPAKYRSFGKNNFLANFERERVGKIEQNIGVP